MSIGLEYVAGITKPTRAEAGHAVRVASSGVDLEYPRAPVQVFSTDPVFGTAIEPDNSASQDLLPTFRVQAVTTDGLTVLKPLVAIADLIAAGYSDRMFTVSQTWIVRDTGDQLTARWGKETFWINGGDLIELGAFTTVKNFDEIGIIPGGGAAGELLISGAFLVYGFRGLAATALRWDASFWFEVFKGPEAV